MTTDDPNYSYLLRRLEALEQLLLANPLRAASVSRGVTEFRDNSTLLITDSNMRVVGVAYVVGRLEGEGDLAWSGNVFLDGPVEITDTLDVLAQTRLRGETTIEGLAKLLSELQVEGKITAGVLTIESSANGGQIGFGEERSINAGSGFLGIYDGDRFIVFNQTGVTIFAGGSTVRVGQAGVEVIGPGRAPAVTVDEGGTKLSAPSRSSLDDVKAWYGEDAEGYLIKVDPGVGGPGKSLSWPFPPSMVTSEYGPREAPTEGASTFHEGLDFGAAEGTPIPSAGSGVVELAGENGGFGNCVVINHGSGLKTRYAHMQTLPYVSAGQTVARAQIIGPVGQTGISRGAHLHFEVEVNGVKVNPRTKLPAA